MSLDEQIQAIRETVIELEKQMRDPQVYFIWKRRNSLKLKELQLELNDLENKRTIEALEELN